MKYIKTVLLLLMMMMMMMTLMMTVYIVHINLQKAMLSCMQAKCKK